MTKRRIILTLVILVNIIVIGSFFLPYRVVSNIYWSNNNQTNGFEYLSGFKVILPLFSLVLLLPFTILFFTSQQKIGRIINLIIAILFILFCLFCFFALSFSIFASAKPGIGAYILFSCSLLVFILAIIHFKTPTNQLKNKELLDDF